jgi:hypothetical protein
VGSLQGSTVACFSAGASKRGNERRRPSRALNYLNQECFWRCIQEKVWEQNFGGYQVVKKWFSYRESNLLGRALNIDEVEQVTDIIRRLAAILLMRPSLDANYVALKKDAYAS